MGTERRDRYGNLMPPTREDFFGLVLERFNSDEVEYIGRAYEFSKAGHHKQERDDGSRYFDHPKMVAWILMYEFGICDWEVIADALLHDTKEDTFLLTHRCFIINFGVNVAHDVDALTKRPEEKGHVEKYLARVEVRGFRTVITKLADRLHNLRTLNHCKPEKQQRIIAETREHFFPLITFLSTLLPPAKPGGWKTDVLVEALFFKEMKNFSFK